MSSSEIFAAETRKNSQEGRKKGRGALETKGDGERIEPPRRQERQTEFGQRERE
jgi:hypothetical protein